MKKILFIDDEPQILQGFRRTLRSMRHQWQMEFASNARDALKAIDTQGDDEPDFEGFLDPED